MSYTCDKLSVSPASLALLLPSLLSCTRSQLPLCLCPKSAAGKNKNPSTACLHLHNLIKPPTHKQPCVLLEPAVSSSRQSLALHRITRGYHAREVTPKSCASPCSIRSAQSYLAQLSQASTDSSHPLAVLDCLLRHVDDRQSPVGVSNKHVPVSILLQMHGKTQWEEPVLDLVYSHAHDLWMTSSQQAPYKHEKVLTGDWKGGSIVLLSHSCICFPLVSRRARYGNYQTNKHAAKNRPRYLQGLRMEDTALSLSCEVQRCQFAPTCTSCERSSLT
eukprot:766570-Hanusia_phi.AAC.8